MKNIAIIGAGISGMASAYLLSQAGHKVTVYEKSSVIGGHTRTLEVNYDDILIPVDTGFIVYNEPNYPNLLGLFRKLDVPVQKSDMSFGVTVDGGRFEWAAQSLNAVFGQRSNLLRPQFYRLIHDVTKFNRLALQAVEQHPGISLGELLEKLRLGEDFRRYYLLPMGGAIWSCPTAQMLEFPAITFVTFFKNHGLLGMSGQHQWYTVTGGSREYLKRLTASYADRIRANCAAVEVTRTENKVSVTDSRGETQGYDKAIFACHANETLALLKDASSDESRILGAFTYQRNTTYLHRDPSIMPMRKRCWASWVYHLEGDAGHAEATGIGVTYWMNRLQAIDARYPLFVTLNPLRPIAEELVFDKHVFEHPVFTAATLAAQKELPKLQGQNNSYFCGAYTRYGFHEDGLLSAVNAVKALGVAIPWH